MQNTLKKASESTRWGAKLGFINGPLAKCVGDVQLVHQYIGLTVHLMMTQLRGSMGVSIELMQ